MKKILGLVATLTILTASVACDAPNDVDEATTSSKEALSPGSNGKTSDEVGTVSAPTSPPSSPPSTEPRFVGAWRASRHQLSPIVFQDLPAPWSGAHHLFAYENDNRFEGFYSVSPELGTIKIWQGESVPDVYKYEFVGDDGLKLHPESGATVFFHRLPSYCDVPADCDHQGVVHVACEGSFTCSVVNECNWVCGSPTSKL